MNYKILFLIILIFFIACSTNNNSQITTIKIEEENYNNSIDLDNYMDSIFYLSVAKNVPMITGINKILFTKNSIIIEEQSIFSNKPVFSIDFSGLLKNTYGSVGKGPNEYISAFDIALNTDNKSLFIYDRNKKSLLEYNTENGLFVNSISIPFYMLQLIFKDNNYVATYADEEGDNEFILFNIKTGIKEFGLYTYNELYEIEIPKVFAQDSNKTYFLRPASDTVFEIENNKLIPSIRINYGKNSVGNKFREIPGFELKNKYLQQMYLALTTEIYASENLLLFNYLKNNELRSFMLDDKNKILFHGKDFVYKNVVLPKPITLWKKFLVFLLFLKYIK